MSKKTYASRTTELLRSWGKLTQYQEVHQCNSTGIVWIEDGSTGVGHSCHPNIDATGSVRGMKKLGYWGEKDVCVRSHGFIYNVSRTIVTDPLDEIVLDLCACGGTHTGRKV